MPLKTEFVVEVNGLPAGKQFDYYPSENEIESVMLERFPKGYIYDQFAGTNIYLEAQVKKYYKLEVKE